MSEQVPAKLVEAARDCLNDYGVSKTSLTDVARRAGVSRTTAYRCFGSKNGMLSEVARVEVELYLALLDEALEAGSSPVDAMRLGVGFSLEYLHGHSLAQRIFRDEPEQVIHLLVERSDSPEMITILSQATAGILARWVEPEALRVPIDEAAEWIVRALYSFMLMPSTRISDANRIASLLTLGISALPATPTRK